MRSAGAPLSFIAVALALLVAAASIPAWAQTQSSNRVTVLRALDKVTARISTIEAPIGETIRFGTLRILAQTCRTRPPEEPPETTAFLEITDIKPGETPVTLFTGWMFASSPALSALEHPVYDVWVIDCRAPVPLSTGGSE